ncbi:MAG: hypothetical protein ACRBFS_12595 [Aureispira sp.]
MLQGESYYHFEYEVHSHYEDSVSVVLLHQQQFQSILKAVLSDEHRLFECIAGAASITLARMEKDDLSSHQPIVESISALPFITIHLSNIQFQYWYEDKEGEEWECDFPQELCITFNEHQEALFWTTKKTPLILKGFEEQSIAGLNPTTDILLQSIFEDLFSQEDKFNWTINISIKPELHPVFSALEGKPLQSQEESSYGFLHIIYENGEATDIDFHTFIGGFS